jgi:transcriptional regulator with XRE-family HTH domain
MLKATFSSEYETFLSLLKHARLDRGLSQVKLAARLGINQSVVSKNERGERRMDVLELRKWCQAVEMPLADFVAVLEDRLSPRRRKRQ